MAPKIPPSKPYESVPVLPALKRVRSSDPPARAPELIRGALRRGHTAMLTGRAKSGKSWAGIALCVAVATGGEWMGFQCERGNVLFVDPELDPRSLDNRFRAVCDAMRADPTTVSEHVLRWSLRGFMLPGGNPPTSYDLATDVDARLESGKMVRGDTSLIVVDSCSALLQGDENDSLHVRRFHSDLLHIAEALDASVVFIHHEGKAQSGDVDSMSRGRGSSSFGDCPDLVLSLVEVFPPSGDRSDYLADGERAFALECAGIREFSPFETRRLIWRYPSFAPDLDGTTEGWKPKSGAQKGGQKTGETQRAKAEQRAHLCTIALLSHMYQHGTDPMEGIPATEAAAICSDALGANVNPQTLKGYVDASDFLDVWQRSPQRWAVVARHPPIQTQLQRAT